MSRSRNNLKAPSWFKLESYDKQSTLDLPGWLLQFGVRRDLLTFLQSSEGGQVDALQNQICPFLMDLIHREPILRLEDLLDAFGPSLIQMILPSVAPLHSSQPRNGMAVHPTTVEELYRAQLYLHPQLRTRAADFFGQMQDGIEEEPMSGEYLIELDNRIKIRKCAPMHEEDGESKQKDKVPYHPRMDHPVYCSFEGAFPDTVLLTVNPNLPDKLLEAHLHDSIRRVRTYLSDVVVSSTRLAKNPVEDWIDEQLLAYLDLSFEKYLSNGGLLTQAETAELIWPGHRPGKGNDKCWGEEHLKSTTASLATEMMAHYSEAFWTLQATAAAVLAKPSLDLQPLASLAASLKKPRTRRNRWKNK